MIKEKNIYCKSITAEEMLNEWKKEMIIITEEKMNIINEK